jgi:aryl-alcohol dehydrogenase-like predicted oxidoreductase
MLGKAIGDRRGEIVLATKFGMDMQGANGPDWGARGSRRYIRLAVEASLTRLGTDWIDLYQLHEPDPFTPVEETLATLDDLVAEGKIRYYGHSNLTGWQIAEAEYEARLGGHQHFVSAQNEYSLLARGVEAEVLPAVRRYGLGFLPYFPLHYGILTGKYTQGAGPDDTRVMREKRYLLDRVDWDALDRLQAFADARGATMLEVAFGWLLAQPNLTSVIAGATTPDQVRQNIAAATAWVPDAADLAEIDALLAPQVS